MPPKTPREGLLRVLALIERGWTKGRFRKRRYDHDCYCISGAMDIAEREGANRADMAVYLYAALPTEGWRNRGLIDFNDAKATTKKAMLAVIKRAIEVAS